MIPQTWIKQWTKLREVTDYIVIHARLAPTSAVEMDGWFRQKGYLQCGFHFCISRGGAHETRSVQSIGAHLPGYDRRSVAVAILGWDGQSALNDDQLRGVAEHTIDHVASLYPDAEIIPATAGFTARADYTELETFVSTLNERRRREGSVSSSH